MIDLSFFSLPVFGYGSVGLLMCCITQGLVTFVAPFYLQDVLDLSPTFMGVIFLAPRSQHGAIARERHLDRSYRRPFALDDRSGPPDVSLSYWRESGRRLSLDLANGPAGDYGDRLRLFLIRGYRR